MMLLCQQIAYACDGIDIHVRLLGHAIEDSGFASEDSYSAIELEAAERRLRALADKLKVQRGALVANEPDIGPVVHLVAAE